MAAEQLALLTTDRRALVDRVRDALRHGPATTDELAAALPDVPRETLEAGLARLHRNGVVTRRGDRWGGW